MKKDLFEQFAENSEDIRVPVSAHSWDKLQARLGQEKKEPKYRLLLRQISVAAAISLIAVNVFVLLFFVSKLNNSAEPNGMVLMEIPEGQDATPRIVPASYFDKVEIQEGSRNNRRTRCERRHVAEIGALSSQISSHLCACGDITFRLAKSNLSRIYKNLFFRNKGLCLKKRNAQKETL